MLPEIPLEQSCTALDLCVAQLLESQGVTEPPIDALRLAAGLGLDVAWDAGQAGRARIVRLPSQTQAVLVRPEPRPERIQWAVAHEIGESLAHQCFTWLKIDASGAPAEARECMANALAVRLLLPTDWYAADAANCGWDLAVLKQRYATASHELIARRMLDFPTAAIVTIYDQGKLQFRRAAAGRAAPPLQPLERACLRDVQDSSHPAQRTDAACIVRGWPIHEALWKREILRTEARDESADVGWQENA